MDLHYCITCEKNLDIDNFYFNKTKNKLFNKCKTCVKQNKKDKQKDTHAHPSKPLQVTDRTLIVGPCFCGKTYLMMNKILLSELENPDREIKIITRSPNQHSQNEQTKGLYPNYTTSQEISTIDDYKDCVVIFDDMLDSNQRELCPFFTRGRHENISVYYLSQRYFELPLIIRDNSNIIILFKQTAKTVQNLYNDIAGFDMNYNEFKDLCREAWNKKYSYLKINRLNDDEKYTICNESEKEYKIFKPKTHFTIVAE